MGICLPKLNQDHIRNFNRPLTSSKIDIVIKSVPTNSNNDLNKGFYQTFQIVVMSIFLKLFYRTETEGTVPNSFYEATVTPYTNHVRPNKEQVLQKNFPYEQMQKFSIKYFQTES